MEEALKQIDSKLEESIVQDIANDVMHMYNEDALYCIHHVLGIKQELLNFPNSKDRLEFWDKVHRKIIATLVID
jgi:hypothetical protein